MEQGLRLAARLNEHRKNIERTNSLRIEDFQCRALVVQTGWETGAEDYLIRLFRPIWNNETKLVFGLGKHGDSADTRRNKRSPWHTLHAGRTWAGAEALADAKSPEKIADELTAHFTRTKIYKTFNDVLAGFVRACGRHSRERSSACVALLHAFALVSSRRMSEALSTRPQQSYQNVSRETFWYD